MLQTSHFTRLFHNAVVGFDSRAHLAIPISRISHSNCRSCSSAGRRSAQQTSGRQHQQVCIVHCAGVTLSKAAFRYRGIRVQHRHARHVSPLPQVHSHVFRRLAPGSGLLRAGSTAKAGPRSVRIPTRRAAKAPSAQQRRRRCACRRRSTCDARPAAAGMCWPATWRRTAWQPRLGRLCRLRGFSIVGFPVCSGHSGIWYH